MKEMKPSSGNRPAIVAYPWRSDPGLGLITTIVGTAAAIFLTPEDVFPAGHLIVPSLALALALLVVPTSVALSSPTSAFNPLHVLAASPVYWLLLDPIQGAYNMERVSSSDVRMTFLAIGSFVFCAWVGGLTRPGAPPRWVMEAAYAPLSPRRLFAISIVAFAFAFSRFAIPSDFDLRVMVGAFSKNRWAAPWARGALGGWDAFLDHIAYFGYILPGLTILLGRTAGFSNWRTVLAAIFAFIIMALLSVGGGRRIIGVMGASAFIVWFLSARPPRLRHLFGFAAVSVGLLIVLQGILIYRGMGLARAFDDSAPAMPDKIAGRPSYLHVDDNFLRLTQIINIIPEHHPHVGLQWIVWVAARPVPRVLWPTKPINPGFDLSTYLRKRDVSLTMSLIGEAYMAFGLWGVCISGLLLGRLAVILGKVLDAGVKPGAMIIFSTGLLALFVGMRSAIELVLMSYAVLAWIVLVWIYRNVVDDTQATRRSRAAAPV